MIEHTSSGKSMTQRRFLRIAGGVTLAGGLICLLAGWLFAVPRLLLSGLAISIVGTAWLVFARFSSSEPMRAHQRRYMGEFLPTMAVYMLIMLLVWPLLDHVHDTAARAAIALSPVMPLAFVVRAFVRMVMRSDELEQRLHLIGLAVASALVVLATMTGAFLAAADVVPLDGKALFWVFPLMMTSYGLAHWWAARHYGVKGGCP